MRLTKPSNPLKNMEPIKLLYTSGQFLFNEKWPENPVKWNYESGGTGYGDDAYVNPEYYVAVEAYESALSQAIKEAVVVNQQLVRTILAFGNIDAKEGSFYELPAEWTVKVGEEVDHTNEIPFILRKTAKVLPVEELVSIVGRIEIDHNKEGVVLEAISGGSVSEGKEDERDIDDFRDFLNTQGYDIDPKDELWMEDCLQDHSYRDLFHLFEKFKRYHITRK